MTWVKYREYVDRHFRYVPLDMYIIGSVPILWDEEDQVVKTLHLKIAKERGAKERLKYLLAEKLTAVWNDIPDSKKGSATDGA